MTRLLAVDPGNTESGWILIDTRNLRPLAFDKTPNPELAAKLRVAYAYDQIAIEQIGHYGTGMPAGRDIFDTCRWIGRFEQIADERGLTPQLVLRATIKTHLCGTTRANDSHIRQALVDRFAPGQRNHGKGTKTDPGWFHGFHRDIWQAYALAVYVADHSTPC